MTRWTTPSILATRTPWVVLAIAAFFMEAFALFSQHVLGLAPCTECIYIRCGVLALFFAGLIGLAAPKSKVTRILAMSLAGYGLGFALHRSVILVSYEQKMAAGEAGGCKRFPGFPAWMDLQKWLPEMFEPGAKCGEILGTFLGQSFAVWTLIGLSALALATVAVLVRDLRRP